MQVMLAASAITATPVAEAADQFLTTYLVNETLAIDAGCLGLLTPLDRQLRIRDVFLSHAHIDHIATLPVFLENVYSPDREPVTIHGSAEVLDALRRFVFNDVVWPDLIRLTTAHTPFLRLAQLEPGRAVQVDGLSVTPVPVEHAVPTYGFLIDDGQSTVVIASDTGPTEEIWRVANERANLSAVFLEATFPEALDELAAISRHLTPASFAREVAKLDRRTRVFAVHLKSRFRAELLIELAALGLPNLSIGEAGRTYSL